MKLADLGAPIARGGVSERLALPHPPASEATLLALAQGSAASAAS